MGTRRPSTTKRRWAKLSSIVFSVTLIGIAVPAMATAKPRLTVTTSSSSVQAGGTVRISGRVRGLPGRPRVLVQQRRGRAWKTLRRTRATRRGAYTATFRAGSAGSLSLRVRATARRRSVTRRLRLTVIRSGGTVPGPGPATPSPTPPPAATPAAIPTPTATPTPTPTATPTPTPTATPTPDPQPDLELDADAITVRAGSAEVVPPPVPLERMTSVTATNAPTGSGVTAQIQGDELVVSAARSATVGSVTLRVRGRGCTADGCERDVLVNVPVTLAPIAAPTGAIDEFTTASPDRVAGAQALPGGGFTLMDELLIVLGTADEPGSRATADAAAAAAGGVVSGGLDDLGIYEVRWTGTQNLAVRKSQLESQPGVTAVTESAGGLVADLAVPPGDWDDDTLSATWHHRQIRAVEAWDLTTGSNVTVGIVDSDAVFVGHEDLAVRAKLSGNSAKHHATHVAGLACGKANGIGLVGAAWGCPVVTTGLGPYSTYEAFDKQVLAAAERTAKYPGVKVINMSLGYKKVCASAAEQAWFLNEALKRKALFRRLFEGIGRGIVWTIAAGNNCAPGVPSPWGRNADLPNVITVAATNSNRTLASFSDFGPEVEVAAPGGQGLGDSASPGVWSTSVKTCGPFGLSTCSDYRADYGTSMAAPLVAGVVALVRSKHPSYGAVEAARCVTDAAGVDTGFAKERSPYPMSAQMQITSGGPSVPIVDARAAVECRSDVRAVRPTTPTTGPAGYGPGIAGPVCDVGDGEEAILEQSIDGTPLLTAYWPGLATGPWTSYASTGWFEGTGTHRVSFRCLGVRYDPYEQREVWRASGFDITLTGSYRPVTLTSDTTTPGGSVTFISGASAGPQACPAIGGAAAFGLSLTVYSADHGSSSRNIDLPTPTTRERLAVPPGVPPGTTLYAAARCNYPFPYASAGFDFVTVPITVE